MTCLDGIHADDRAPESLRKLRVEGWVIAWPLAGQRGLWWDTRTVYVTKESAAAAWGGSAEEVGAVGRYSTSDAPDGDGAHGYWLIDLVEHLEA